MGSDRKIIQVCSGKNKSIQLAQEMEEDKDFSWVWSKGVSHLVFLYSILVPSSATKFHIISFH